MKSLQKWKISFIVFIIMAATYGGFLQFKISEYSHLKTPENADYLIVLGTSVKGQVPSKALSCRINTAAHFLQKNKHTIIIASGGKGKAEKISEAESIKRELIKRGIDESRIIKEDRSTNTKENIRFSKQLLPDKNMSGVIVTNNFHMYRSLSIAHDQHLKVQGLPASTPKNAIIKLYTREYLAITKYYLLKYVI
ncbi:YdcF family protein [Neobacillus sp. LXY-1]|uniref:YdcF family protein n=1 Tax=Neobacillus sp. LXY-1 TaxID=3379133 RepID=UPI003EE2C6BF